jgi:hypothetical protein
MGNFFSLSNWDDEVKEVMPNKKNNVRINVKPIDSTTSNSNEIDVIGNTIESNAEPENVVAPNAAVAVHSGAEPTNESVEVKAVSNTPTVNAAVAVHSGAEPTNESVEVKAVSNTPTVNAAVAVHSGAEPTNDSNTPTVNAAVDVAAVGGKRRRTRRKRRANKNSRKAK